MAQNIGTIKPVNIVDEMQRSYLDYAMSVIVSRALPDVRDGMKPVHRRILFAMHKLGLTHSAKYRKSATVVGEVLGKYHPHGDVPVYDSMVRLAQDFAMRYPLVDGQGNFGSVDGDRAAAMRYTEARMSRIADEMLVDIEKNTVPVMPNFDGTLDEPVYLPAKLPNLLLMGSDGIAVGMATKIAPHNLGEVVDAVVYLIDNPESAVEDLLGFIKGPDFPTGGIIYDWQEVVNGYATGRGRVVTRAKADIEEDKNGRFAIIVTEIPYQVNKAMLITKIADLVKDKKIEGISDLRDESDRKGMRIVIELKRDARPQAILNNLYKHTAMQSVFNMNMVALVEGTPHLLTLKMILAEYVKHRQLVVTRRTQFELDQAKKRAHILEGLKIALDNLDAVIETIRRSKDAEEARGNLMKKFGLSEIQATAILDMQLRRLAALERKKIEDEYKQIMELIGYLEDLLAHPKKILTVIKQELAELKEKYGDKRRTRVIKSKIGEFSEEDLIPNDATMVTVTKSGYVKRQSLDSFRMQKRGGKGIVGMTTKDQDEIIYLVHCKLHDNILFFTDKGKVYQVKGYDIPEGSRTSKGQAIINLIDITPQEKVTSLLALTKDSDAKYTVMLTSKGVVKKTTLKEYEKIRKNGLIAIKLSQSDRLVWVKLTSGNDLISLVSSFGKSIKFHERDIRSTGRDTMGVRGILLREKDEVIGMDIVSEDDKSATLLVVTQKGMGKKTLVSNFPKQLRGGMGVKACEVTSRTGAVVAARVVPKDAQFLILTSAKGQVVKIPLKSVPSLSRATQGVILMRFSDKGDYVAASAVMSEDIPVVNHGDVTSV